MEAGDIIFRSTVKNPQFYHEGIFVGNNKVIHIMNRGMNVYVVKETLEKFASNKNVKIKKIKTKYSKQDMVKRAESMVGQKISYDIFLNNCENFTNMVANDKNVSLQGHLVIETSCNFANLSYSKKKDLSSWIEGFIRGYFVSHTINELLYK